MTASSRSEQTSNPSSSTSANITKEGTQRRRAGRACDLCNRRGVKCVILADEEGCERCEKSAATCTFSRPVRKRGPVPKKVEKLAVPRRKTASTKWIPSPVASSDRVEELIEQAQHTFYPIYTYFHWPTLLEKVRSGLHIQDRSFSATILALCALTASRSSSGQPSPGSSPSETLELSESFIKAAEQALVIEPGVLATFDDVRAAKLLACTAIQHGKTKEMAHWLGICTTLAMVSGLWDENHWPSNLTVHEVEERRRLVWAAYQFDVYTSIVWGHPVLHRGSQLRVSYPKEASVLSFDPAIINQDEMYWIFGWNRVTDLYRILEHSIDQLRNAQIPLPGNFPAFIMPEKFTESIDSLYSSLPDYFRTFRDDGSQYLNTQTANLLITVQMARVISLCSIGIAGDESINILSNLVHSLASVPPACLVSLSLPMFHQLAAIGAVLASSLVLHQTTLARIQTVLAETLELLLRLEAHSNLSIIARATGRLSQYIEQVNGLAANMSSLPQLEANGTNELVEQSIAADFPTDFLQNWELYDGDDLLFPDLLG
ncbi:hypothetical protein T439DRAFT_328316 [Meredithblackwellia eburnea MCA 4105]